MNFASIILTIFFLLGGVIAGYGMLACLEGREGSSSSPNFAITTLLSGLFGGLSTP